MANVYLVAWDSAAEVAMGDPIEFLVAIIDGNNSAALSGTGRKRKRVRIHADADVHINFFDANNDPDPTVSTDGSDALTLDANNPEYFDMEVGRVLKAITRT